MIKKKFKVVKDAHWRDPKTLSEDACRYQRPIKQIKVTKLTKSMEEMGWLADSVIVVGEPHGKVIAGHHRLRAAKAVGIGEVLVAVLQFSTEKDEAEFYNFTAKWNPSQSQPERIKSMRIQGHSWAKFVYKLNTDTSSPLYDRIQVLDLDNPIDAPVSNKGSSRRFTLAQVTFMVNTLFGIGRDVDDDKLKKLVDTRTEAEIYSELRGYVTFVEECYGKITENGKHEVYKDRVQKGMIRFYAELLKHVLRKPTGGIDKRKRTAAVKRMQKFSFNEIDDSRTRKHTVFGAYFLFSTHYNANSKHTIKTW